MAWQKGQSGNPGGRPKGLKEVQEAARKHTTDAIETLASIAKDTEQSASARVSAAEVLLDRGWGKAQQTIEVEGLSGLPDHVIEAILAACDLIESVKSDSGGSSKGKTIPDGNPGETAH